jgi:hypothetical protein
MFENNKKRYMTRAVAEELSDEHQQFILAYIEENQKQLTDYFQIFEFYIEENQQWIIQRQEEPKRETTIYIDLKNAKQIERKVWVTDQVDHIIFPEDY